MLTTRTEILADGVTLHMGDCREILPTLGARADALITDPPYRLTSGGNTRNEVWKGALFGQDDYENGGDLIAQVPWHEWLPLAFAACAPTADCYVMANDKNLEDALREVRTAGFGLHNVLVWRKENGTPNRWYFKDCEYTVYGWKGAARTINTPSSRQHFYCPRDQKEGHPTQKPVELMRLYIENSTSFGGVVLDPFAGSGTTGVAAVKAGRQFVGIEIEQKWFDLACRRMTDALARPSLFVDRPARAEKPAELDFATGRP